jgi:hypothetical protein
MGKTITIKIKDKSENVEGVIRNLIRLYEDEIDSFRMIDERPKK